MDRREPLIVTALVAGLVSMGSAQPSAQRESDSRPTLAVVSFNGVPTETGDAMADELAAQFVETGRYRVMPRTWLTAPTESRHTPLTALREAAAAANIKYLVMGEAQHGMSLGSTARDLLFLEVRVISVATGDVVRTATGRTQAALPRPSRRPRVGLMTQPRAGTRVFGHVTASGALAQRAGIVSRPPVPTAGPVAPATQAIASMTPPTRNPGILERLFASAISALRQKPRSTRSTPPIVVAKDGWKAPLADIAKAITLPGESR